MASCARDNPSFDPAAALCNDEAGNGVHGSASDYLAQQQAFADSTIELLEAFP
jgi:hypothetical protein